MRFWTREFFEAAADRVNDDQRVGSQIGGIATDIVAGSSDTGDGVFIHVEGGRIAVRPSTREDAPEFSFTAPYQEWVNIIRDSLDIRGEVLKGRVKFRGSMPKMLLYLGRVSRMEKEIIQKMRSLNPEY